MRSQNPAQNRRTVIFADPGIDDAIALLVAAALPDHLYVVATYGNGPVTKTAANLRGITDFITQSLKDPSFTSQQLFVGAGSPQKNEFSSEDLAFIHGANLCEGQFENADPVATPSQTLYDQLKHRGESIDIVSLGATTELAYLLDHIGDLAIITSITIMGGALYAQGNVTPRVEANFAHDPFALQRALTIAQRSKIPVTLVPLDVTEDPGLELTTEQLTALTDELWQRGSTHVADLLLRLAGPDTTYPNFYRNKRGVFHPENPYQEHRFSGSPIHDLTALMAKQHPELFRIAKLPLTIEDSGAMGVPTAWMEPGTECNVVLKIQYPKRYWQLTTDYLASYK